MQSNVKFTKSYLMESMKHRFSILTQLSILFKGSPINMTSKHILLFMLKVILDENDICKNRGLILDILQDRI